MEADASFHFQFDDLLRTPLPSPTTVLRPGDSLENPPRESIAPPSPPATPGEAAAAATAARSATEEGVQVKTQFQGIFCGLIAGSMLRQCGKVFPVHLLWLTCTCTD